MTSPPICVALFLVTYHYLRDSQEDQRTLEMLKSEAREAIETAELERYHAVEKERAKWEEREARLLAQLNEAQSRMVEEQGRGGQEFQDNLSYSNWEEEDEGGHLFQDSGGARVTFSAPVTTVSVASPAAQPSVLISDGTCRSVNNVSPGGSYQSEVLNARFTSRPGTVGFGGSSDLCAWQNRGNGAGVVTSTRVMGTHGPSTQLGTAPEVSSLPTLAAKTPMTQ